MKRASKTRVLVIALIAVLIAASTSIAASYYYYQNSDGSTTNSVCDSISSNASIYFETGFSHVCGIGKASDGRLQIIVHNYHFAQTKDIQFQFSSNQESPLPYEVFLLVNMTVENIGGGNATVIPSFQAGLLNGSSYVDSTEFIANASFPNTFPNLTIPNYQTAQNVIYLPPGAKADFWMFFYIGFQTPVSSNIGKAENFKLQLITYNEDSYGGIFDGLAGGFNCQKVVCQNTNTEFIIQAM